MDLTNKKIILTGASAGIGLEMLLLLSKYKQVQIVAVARHTEDIPEMKGVIYPFAADASNQKGVDSIFDFAIQVLGGVDVFIANAGFAYIEKLDKPDWEHAQRIFDLNVFSPVYALERLTSINGNSPTAFVCTVSGAGLVSLPAYSLYCSTKAALHHFIETYRYEQKRNLQLTAVYPVATRTDFFDKAASEKATPLPFPAQDTKTVAKKIVRGIEKGKKTIYPSLLFRLGYPVGRAFPFLLKGYSLLEKRKVKKWLKD
ncbi:MAG: SDR family NAD(P)-dependent oxidoreductase [Prevotella sp.]|jgi:short-subunit dehydrogenase|nr:SDR family NAD(P)-dependent oxidoreductase [Prevotella sp.]